MIVQRLLRITRTVADLQRTRAFYETALGFVAVGQAGLRMRLGEQEVEFVTTDPPPAPYPPGSTSADLWFQHFAMVTNDIGKSYARLSGHGFTPISLDGPQRLPEASGGATAFKFRDPDGHPLELIQFPGPARPVGIDHSAISVADTGRSIEFYTGLGLSLGPRQVNTGPEQDRLDALSQARVDVVALRPRAMETPHVELLGYQHPKGRAAPPGIMPSRLVLLVDQTPDGSSAATLRDPDGHELLLVAATQPHALSTGPNASMADTVRSRVK